MEKIKFTFKKTVAVLMCFCVFLSSAVLSSSAIDPDIHASETTNILNIILGSQNGDETRFMKMTLESTTRVLEKLGKADSAAKVMESAGTWSKIFSTAMGIIGPASQTFTLINGSINFLRTIGVIEDPTQTRLESIENTVKSIQQTVQEIDSKIDDLDADVINLLTELKYTDRINKYWNYHNQWTTFYNACISRMNTLKTNYTNNLISLTLDYGEEWQNGTAMGLRSLYNKNGEQIYSAHNLDSAGSSLPQCPGTSSDSTPVSYSITVPDGYVNIDRDINLNAENYLSVFREAVTEAVINAANDGKLIAYNGFYNKWNNMTASEKENSAQAIAEDLIDALMFEISYAVANNTDFISNLESAFTDYCKYLCKKESLISPFDAQLQMLAFTHGFEGEIKDEAAYMYSYFNNLTLDYGMFMTMIMSLAQIKTTAQRTEYRNMWQETLDNIYNDLDNFITGNNNYCYILGCPLEYRNIEFNSQVSFTCHYPLLDPKDPESQYYSFTYDENAKSSRSWTLIDKSKIYNRNDTAQVNQNQNELKQNMLSSDEISLIYRVYSCEANGNQVDNQSFIDYLVNNNVAMPRNASDTQSPYGLNSKLITSGFSTSDLDLNSGAVMTNIKKCFEECRYYFAENTPVVLKDKIPGDKDCYVIHDRIVGDMFNLNTGKLSANSDIISRIFYGENDMFWFTDEIWGLSTGKMNISHTSEVFKNDENSFGNRTYNIDYYDDFSTIVKTETGSYTIPADVKSIGDGVFTSGMIVDNLTFNGKPDSISENAFDGVGTEFHRCYVNVPDSWTDFSLGDKWHGGYFGDAHIITDSDNSSGIRKTVTVYKGMPCMNVPYLLGNKAIPEHKVFEGWSRTSCGMALSNPYVTITDGMTLYSVWKFDHSFLPLDTINPTCTEDGLTGKTTCSVCGETGEKGIIIPRLGHNYEINSLTGESVCTRCGKTCTMQTAQFGDFIVTGEDIYNTVSFNANVLSVIGEAPVTIANKYPDYPTRNTIYIGDNINADITLAGVNIEPNYKTAAVSIEDFSGSTVCITIADKTENILKGYADCAAIQANGLFDGTLKIYGNGKLTATGGENGAGIGGGKSVLTKNIMILGGNITAIAGNNAAAIGAGNNGYAPKIEIIRGIITANSIGNTVDERSGSAAPCELIIYKTASVKTNDSDLFAVNENRELVYLNEIENSCGNLIYIDGEKFPYTEHNGEKKVYVYLTDEEHSIETNLTSKFLTSKGTTVIDYENGYIYGINPGTVDMKTCVAPADGYEMQVSCSSAKCGTGTTVDVCFEGKTVGSFVVILFGDVNGDGIYDGNDAVIVSCLASGMLTKKQVSNAQYMAADCNHDNTVNGDDVSLLAQAGLLLAEIDQSKSQEELLTNSAYTEYLNLIKQTDEPIDENFNQSIFKLIFNIIIHIFTMIRAFWSNGKTLLRLG